MAKRIITLVFVVILGIIIGVAIATKQAKTPLLQEMLAQQDNILAAQQRMEKRMMEPVGPTKPVFFDKNGSVVDDGSPAVNDVQIKALTARVANLETQVGELEKVLSPVIQQLKRPKPKPEDLNKVYNINVQGSPVRGNKDAKVTIVEFTDMQCPYCAHFHPVLLDVLKAYPKDVKYILKNFPLSFHKEALPAAKATLAAKEQGKYFEMVDAILENNKNLSDERFEQIAKDIGLNVKKFKKDYKDKDAEWNNIISRDKADASKVDVRGTPTFFINGKKTRARTVEQFKAAIDSILNGKK